MKKCLIISGGQFEKIKLKDKYDLIIACDKGYLHAKKLKIHPDIIIGDFDSAKEPVESKNICKSNVGATHREPAIIKVDTIKDDTDTGLAVKYALRNGYKSIDIICALGGRIDHTFANISLMKYIIENRGAVRILSNDATLMSFGKGKTRIKKENNKYLSLFSLSDKSKIDYIKGTKYDVKNITLKNGFPLGVSNEFNKSFAEMKIAKGIILVVTVKMI